MVDNKIYYKTIVGLPALSGNFIYYERTKIINLEDIPLPELIKISSKLNKENSNRLVCIQLSNYINGRVPTS